jgi:hypothetical protein
MGYGQHERHVRQRPDPRGPPPSEISELRPFDRGNGRGYAHDDSRIIGRSALREEVDRCQPGLNQAASGRLVRTRITVVGRLMADCVLSRAEAV